MSWCADGGVTVQHLGERSLFLFDFFYAIRLILLAVILEHLFFPSSPASPSSRYSPPPPSSSSVTASGSSSARSSQADVGGAASQVVAGRARDGWTMVAAPGGQPRLPGGGSLSATSANNGSCLGCGGQDRRPSLNARCRPSRVLLPGTTALDTDHA
jgi:hypothetical protein